MKNKSSVEEIRQRFDAEVERFSNLETGHANSVDSPLVMQLIVEAAAAVTPRAVSMLDIGCGAGNYTLKLLESFPRLDITLLDLSQPMLDRAYERIHKVNAGPVTRLQGDVREVDLGENRFDIVVCAAVLHHLRTDLEWQTVFQKIYRALKPGGSFWISDLIEQTDPALQKMIWNHYGEYLTSLKNEAYRDFVYDFIDKEDSPRPLLYQIDLMRSAGFENVDILHKNLCFAAFGGIKRATVKSV